MKLANLQIPAKLTQPNYFCVTKEITLNDIRGHFIDQIFRENTLTFSKNMGECIKLITNTFQDVVTKFGDQQVTELTYDDIRLIVKLFFKEWLFEIICNEVQFSIEKDLCNVSAQDLFDQHKASEFDEMNLQGLPDFLSRMDGKDWVDLYKKIGATDYRMEFVDYVDNLLRGGNYYESHSNDYLIEKSEIERELDGIIQESLDKHKKYIDNIFDGFFDDDCPDHLTDIVFWHLGTKEEFEQEIQNHFEGKFGI